MYLPLFLYIKKDDILDLYMSILEKFYKNKKIIYTACFGEYDTKIKKNFDKYYDEDNNVFDGCKDHLSPRLMAKLYKVVNPLSHEIWIDANFEILNRRKFESLFDGDISIFKHPFNKTLRDELDLCFQIGYVNEKQVKNIELLYESAGMKVEETPVYACTMIYRNEKGQKINDLWWKLITQYSYRDQLTFPYVLNTYKDLDIRIIDLDIYNNIFTKNSKHIL